MQRQNYRSTKREKCVAMYLTPINYAPECTSSKKDIQNQGCRKLPKFGWASIVWEHNLSYLVNIKEGCNRGHGLSVAIKLGSLEKTIGASLIALWCALSSPFFVEKTKLHNLWPS